jgi:hypothetical protein
MEERVIQRFWLDLLYFAKRETQLHSKRLANVPKGHDCKASSGFKGISYLYEIHDNRGYAHILLEGPKDYNKSIFRQLEQWKVEIHASFGDELEWHLMPNQKSSYFGKYFRSGGLLQLERWPEIQGEMIDTMVRLERTIPTFLARLKT